LQIKNLSPFVKNLLNINKLRIFESVKFSLDNKKRHLKAISSGLGGMIYEFDLIIISEDCYYSLKIMK
jgi:hypothetical protein